MKTKITLITMILAFFGLSHNSHAQSLFKDLQPGSISSNPEQFMNVNGTMYFITVSNYVHALWKTDGTVANTVKVKDSIITTNVGSAVYLRGCISDTLYFSVNSQGITAGTTTYLWKTNGGTPVIVDTLLHPGNLYPVGFTFLGSKIFFSMGKNNGRELWVTDGTEAGTQEVIDLLPGANGGVTSAPMIAYNGKVYFQGNTTLGNTELFSSDGTAGGTTLVKDIKPGLGGSDPKSFIVYNNNLYFDADATGSSEGIWKTDGTTGGTVNITTNGFNSNTKIFQNNMYYTLNGALWKSDGTTAGTALVKDSVGGINGFTSTEFFTSYMKSLSVPPYYKMYYWRSDGTTGGTVRVSDSLGLSASFAVLNNKMYNAVTGSSTVASGIWESDGTVAGTKNLFAASYIGIPFVFNSDVFFSNFGSGTGYELWWLTPSANAVSEVFVDRDQLNIYPNPSSGKFQISVNKTSAEPMHIKVTDVLGKEVYTEKLLSNADTYVLDLGHLQNGVYFLNTGNSDPKKVIIQK